MSRLVFQHPVGRGHLAVVDEDTHSHVCGDEREVAGVGSKSQKDTLGDLPVVLSYDTGSPGFWVYSVVTDYEYWFIPRSLRPVVSRRNCSSNKVF